MQVFAHAIRTVLLAAIIAMDVGSAAVARVDCGMARRPNAAQLDLLVADLVGVPAKGERETLTLPLFSPQI